MPGFHIKNVKQVTEQLSSFQQMEKTLAEIKRPLVPRPMTKKGGILEFVVRVENVKKLHKAEDEPRNLEARKYVPWSRVSDVLRTTHDNR